METYLERLRYLRQQRERANDVQIAILAEQERAIVGAARRNCPYSVIAEAAGVSKSWVAKLVNRPPGKRLPHKARQPRYSGDE